MKKKIYKHYAQRKKVYAFRLLPSALLITVSCLFQVPAASLAAEEVTIKASANREQLYLGESFILELTVSGTTEQAEVDFSSLPKANIRPLGTRNISNFYITIVNGKMTREGFTGFVSSYEITPLAAGPFRAGPVRLRIGGQTYSDPGPVVAVTDIEQQDTVIISVSASRETALMDESFDVTLSVRMKALPGEAASIEPLFPDRPPALSVPWLEQEMPGLAGPDPHRVLTEHLAPHWNQPGMTINRFTLAPDPFDLASMFSREQRKAKFALPRRIISSGGHTYWEYTLAMRYTAKDEGNYVFGPVIFKGAVPLRLDEHGRMDGTHIFAVGPACTVRVIPPPEEGRPESYTGAVGSNLQVTASLDANSCKLDDPLTLTLTVSGNVKLDKVMPPKLSLQTNILDKFTVYDGTVQSVKKDSYNQYVYTVRPNQAGPCAFPPVEISYYDVNSRSYKTVATKELPLFVKRGAEVTEAQVIANTNRMQARLNEEADVRKLAPAPFRLESAGARSESLVGGPTVALIAGAGPAIYFLFALATFLNRSASAFRARRHIHSARSRARRRLRAAVKLERTDHRKGALLFCEIARKYLGERLSRDTDALTPSEILHLAADSRLADSLAQEFNALYEKYFNAGFANAPLQSNFAEDCAALEKLIGRIESQLGHRSMAGKPPRRASPMSIFLVTCLIAGAEARAIDSSEREFIWNEANAAAGNARTPSEFLGAARTYQRLLEDGVRNGPLLYNLGTALIHAQRYSQAADALERAERFMGWQPDLERNLEIAYANKMNVRKASLPWHRIAFFWHYYLSCPKRALIAACAFLVFWIALTMRRLGMARLTGAMAAAGFTAFVIFASSTAASWQMENVSGSYRLDVPTAFAHDDAAATNTAPAKP